MAKRAETALQFYLGIDPGRDKTGVALVEETGRILAVQVMRTRNFSDALLQFLYDRLQVSNTWGLRKILKAVVLGNGTGSEEHKQWVEKALPGYPVYIVDEKYSTEEARALYWKLYPPRFPWGCKPRRNPWTVTLRWFRCTVLWSRKTRRMRIVKP